jgi:beta-lactamase superfamily II metal-dependent hydrolase
MYTIHGIKRYNTSQNGTIKIKKGKPIETRGRF